MFGLSTVTCISRQKCGGAILTYCKFKWSNDISFIEPTPLSFVSAANVLVISVPHPYYTFVILVLFLSLVLMSDSFMQSDHIP